MLKKFISKCDFFSTACHSSFAQLLAVEKDRCVTNTCILIHYQERKGLRAHSSGGQRYEWNKLASYFPGGHSIRNGALFSK